MGWSITVGRIAGTAIRLHFTFILFLVWIGVADYIANGPAAAASSVAFILLVFLCVTLHEFGHILMARRFGVRTPEVILSPIGGIANMERIPEKPVQELLVAIAGPLVNVVIAVVLMAGFGLGAADYASADFERATLVQRLFMVNVTLVLFNLIPAFPMDGGRVLRALLSMAMGAKQATALAARIGQGFAFLFVLAGLFYSPILALVGVFIYFAAASEEQSQAFINFASALRASDAMEASAAVLDQSSPLADAIAQLLRSPQRDFPVADASGRAIGMLDRDAMLAGLHSGSPETRIGEVMREAQPIPPDLPLVEAFTRLRSRRVSAEVVAGSEGKVLGVITLDNISEMIMIENAKPGWSFARKA